MTEQRKEVKRKIIKTISNLGITLRRYRIQYKITAKQFANDVGIGVVYLYRIETNRIPLSESFYIKLLIYFVSRGRLTVDIKLALEERVIYKSFINNLDSLFKSKTLLTIFSGKFTNNDIELLLTDLKQEMYNFKPKITENN